MSSNITPRIWLASDWHFGHEKILELEVRPQDYEARIVDSVLSTLQPQDILLNLGDWGLYKTGLERVEALLKLLQSRGIKTWGILGNHDPKLLRAMSLGFHMVAESLSFEMFGKNILFTHIPADWEHMGTVPRVANKNTKDPTDYYPFDVNIHGHLHNIGGHGIRGDFFNDGHHILISSELCDYHPILLETALRFRVPKWEGGRFVEAAPPMTGIETVEEAL